MDEEKNKMKEYYQVNLDMGRIFWIVFLIGIILIGIFVFGFYIGGGKLKENLLSMGKVHVSQVAKEKTTENTADNRKNEVSLDELFSQSKGSEVQYIDENSVTTAVKNAQKEGFTSKSAKKHLTVKKYSNLPVKSRIKKSKITPKRRISAAKIYYIQVASFSQKENAQKLRVQLTKSLYKVRIEEKKLANTTYYRVRVGPFNSKTVANNTLIAMKRRFDLPDPFVVQKGS